MNCHLCGVIASQTGIGRVMFDDGPIKIFLCGRCEHRIVSREYPGQIVCIQTLEFHDRDNIATCECAQLADFPMMEAV